VQLINNIAEAALELGATNVMLKTDATTDAVSQEWAAELAPKMADRHRLEYRQRAAAAALALLRGGRQ
jgi:hypothetical protein